jgi:hypothetical protein
MEASALTVLTSRPLQKEKNARGAPLGLWFCCGISAFGSGQFDGGSLDVM